MKRKPYIWPKLRTKPKPDPEPSNVTEAWRGHLAHTAVVDEFVDFGKSVASDPVPDPTPSPAPVSDPVPALVDERATPLVVESVTADLPDVPADLGEDKPKRIWNQGMPKAELLRIAQDLGVTLDSDPTKAEIIDALRAHDSNG